MNTNDLHHSSTQKTYCDFDRLGIFPCWSSMTLSPTPSDMSWSSDTNSPRHYFLHHIHRIGSSHHLQDFLSMPRLLWTRRNRSHLVHFFCGNTHSRKPSGFRNSSNHTWKQRLLSELISVCSEMLKGSSTKKWIHKTGQCLLPQLRWSISEICSTCRKDEEPNCWLNRHLYNGILYQ